MVSFLSVRSKAINLCSSIFFDFMLPFQSPPLLLALLYALLQSKNIWKKCLQLSPLISHHLFSPHPTAIRLPVLIFCLLRLANIITLTFNLCDWSKWSLFFPYHISRLTKLAMFSIFKHFFLKLFMAPHCPSFPYLNDFFLSAFRAIPSSSAQPLHIEVPVSFRSRIPSLYPHSPSR